MDRANVTNVDKNDGGLDGKQWYITADAHEEFRNKVGARNTEIWRQACPNDTPIAIKEWWPK
eukprot:7530179-Karenia_brevis.AAC.1